MSKPIVLAVLRLSLSENETKAFNVLVSLKNPKKASHIAQLAQLPRMTTSDILKKLHAKRIAKRWFKDTYEVVI